MNRLDAAGRFGFYPIFILGRAALLLWLFGVFGAGFPPVMLGFVVGSLVLLVAAERWIPYREDWATRGDSQLLNDIGHSVGYVLASGPVVQVLGVSAAMTLAGSGEARLWRGIWPDGWSSALQIPLVLVLGDLLDYWFHRLTHRVSWLWPLHVLHHTPQRLHALKTLRHHWLFGVVRGSFILLPLLALGAPLAILLWVGVALALVGSAAHANIGVRLPSWVSRVVNTPDLHRLHHSIEPGQGNSNFCGAFPLWDILFGTFRAPELAPVAETGLADDPVPSGFWKQVALPLTLRARP